jgi:hypothetical protein
LFLATLRRRPLKTDNDLRRHCPAVTVRGAVSSSSRR